MFIYSQHIWRVDFPAAPLVYILLVKHMIMNCPSIADTAAMLVFLRGAKFSQIRAREMMEGNLSLKAFAPDWFLEIDSLDTKIQEVIDTGSVSKVTDLMGGP